MMAILRFCWVFTGLVILLSGHCSGDFGDLGEEHDLDDMINNKIIQQQQQNNVNKRDSIASPSTSHLHNDEYEVSDDASGSGSGADETEKESSEINQSDDTENSISQSETTQNSIDQSAAGRKNTIDQSIDSTKKNTITTDKLHLLQKINEHNTEQRIIAKNIEREKAVNFAKFFRDGTTGVVREAHSKRNNIAVKPPQYSSLRPEVFGRRNVIGYQQALPSVDEIFKRDRIQIHKNLAKLSAKYKDSNPLLKDLSKFTSDQAPNPIWKKFLHDAKSAVAITKRQNLLGYMFKPSTATPNNNNNKGAMFVAGNHLYKKVGNIAINPSEIQDARKNQYFSQQPQQPRQQQQQQYSPQKPMYSVQTHINPQTVYAAYNRPQPAQQPAAVYHNLNGVNGCLPENARCEKGHDEQCCGSQSYCVNYWGSGKCVAFKPTDKADRTNPYKMLANLNAKTNFNAMLNQVKNELSAYSYHRKVGDVLKINDIY